MRFNDVAGWLSWQETLNPKEIELGLERVRRVWQNLSPGALPFKVITVAGTNGKGSSVAMLSSILTCAGFRTGCYLSPHLLQYNERIRINERDIEDANLCLAFQRVDEARGETSLTYFEFGTLAALSVFTEAQLDVVILETGLGGRLDAVNILDTDVALITSIGIDHTDWLGDDRESIATEKAGIIRAGRPVICGDPSLPVAIETGAKKLDCTLEWIGRDFGFEQTGQDNHRTWSYWRRSDQAHQYYGLPMPALEGEQQLQNAASVLTVLKHLEGCLPGFTGCSLAQISDGLQRTWLPGRFQTLTAAGENTPVLIVDVAHNAQSAETLARSLAADRVAGKTIAVFGMLADKDIGAVATAMAASIDRWFIAPVVAERTARVEEMIAALKTAGIGGVKCCDSVSDALSSALQLATRDDRIIVFGSFYTVAEIVSQHAKYRV